MPTPNHLDDCPPVISFADVEEVLHALTGRQLVAFMRKVNKIDPTAGLSINGQRLCLYIHPRNAAQVRTKVGGIIDALLPGARA